MDEVLRLAAFADQLEQRQLAARVKKQARLWKPTATSATMLGYACERRIVYQRVMPWAADPISPELASIFREGDLHERDVFRELEDDLGVKVRERNSSFRDTGLDLVGALDAEVFVEGVGWVPTEVKGLSFIPGDSVDGADLADDPKALHRRYFAQVQIYLFLKSKPLGLFIFKSKVTGRWRVVPIALDYEATEVLLKRAERVRDAVRRYVRAFEAVRPFTQDGPADLDVQVDQPNLATAWDEAMAAAESMLPDRIVDRSECAACPWRRTCNPSRAPVDPALLIEDGPLIEMLTLREQAKAQRKIYETAHKQLKARFDQTGGSVWFAGEFRIERKPHGKFTKLDITHQGESHGAAEQPDPS